jgi:hypothetical protein
MIQEYYIIYFKDKTEKRITVEQGEKIKTFLTEGKDWIKIGDDMHRTQFINEIIKHKEHILG